jgi:phosphate transport system substrate-binding protein
MTKLPPIAYIAGIGIVGAGLIFGAKNFLGASNSTPSLPVASQAPAKVNTPIKVRVDGSTSMVVLNDQIKALFPSESRITLQARGTGAGISGLISGAVDVAAISRPLTEQELAKGLVQHPVGQDVIAFAVSARNQINDISLTKLKPLFLGQDKTFRLIHRPKSSGTWQTVSKALGVSQQVGTVLPSDGTTVMLQKLGVDGLGYGTASQLEAQSTAKVLTIDGKSPGDDGYPAALSRDLFYATKGQPSADAEAFISAAKDVLN